MTHDNQDVLEQLLGMIQEDTVSLEDQINEDEDDELDELDDDGEIDDMDGADAVDDEDDDDTISDMEGETPFVDIPESEPQEVVVDEPIEDVPEDSIVVIPVAAKTVTTPKPVVERQKRKYTKRDENTPKAERKHRTPKAEALPAEPLPSWAIPFSSATDDIGFTEYGHEYKYVRQMDPDGEPTGYFLPFYKHDADSAWHVHKTGLLSHLYVASRIEPLMNTLCGHLNSSDMKHSSVPFELVVRVKTDQSVAIMTDESEKIAYEMVCGKSGDDLETKFTVEIAAMTAYNGTHRVSFDYIISNADRTMTNYFVLGSEMQSLRHHQGSSLLQVAAGVKPVSESYAAIVEQLKAHKDGFDGWVETLMSKLKKVQLNVFGGYVEGLPAEHRNLLTLSVILSKTLDSFYDPKLHFVLRNEFQKIVDSVMKK